MAKDSSLAAARDLVRVVPSGMVGVYFRDDSCLMSNARAWRDVVRETTAHLDKKVNVVLAIATRGIPFGTATAFYLQAGLVVTHANGKLNIPFDEEFFQMEYGSASMRIAQGAIKKGSKVVLADNAVSTGATLEAANRLVQRQGAEVIGAITLHELTPFGGRQRLIKLGIPLVSTFQWDR